MTKTAVDACRRVQLRRVLSAEVEATNSSCKKALPESVYRNNGTAIYPVKVDPTSKSQLIDVATALCPKLSQDLDDSVASFQSSSFSSSDDEEPFPHLLSVEALTGGLSNELFVVRNSEGSAVLVRINPDTPAPVVDRDVENKLLAWLSQNSLAPLLYGRFENGRVEEFYANAIPLTVPEMHENADQIGRIMGRLHAIKPPPGIFSPSSTGGAWQRLDDWIEAANQHIPEEKSKLLAEIEDEWNWLKDAFEHQKPSRATEFLKQTVLTHMDCQSSNLLKLKEGELKLIDYEYAGLNPRGADIANTFCEFTNMNDICADFEEEYPSKSTQHEFLECYIAATDATMIPTTAFLNDLCDQIGRYTVFSHLHWAVWSLLQVKSDNNIEFDYGAYAEHRMDCYRYCIWRFWEAEISPVPL